MFSLRSPHKSLPRVPPTDVRTADRAVNVAVVPEHRVVAEFHLRRAALRTGVARAEDGVGDLPTLIVSVHGSHRLLRPPLRLCRCPARGRGERPPEGASCGFLESIERGQGVGRSTTLRPPPSLDPRGASFPRRAGDRHQCRHERRLTSSAVVPLCVPARRGRLFAEASLLPTHNIAY